MEFVVQLVAVMASLLLSSALAAGDWYCPMHPQVRRPEPGRCPLCEMELVKRSSAAPSGTEDAVYLSAKERRQAEVETTIVRRRDVDAEV